MSVQTIFDFSVTLALAILSLSFFVTIYRIIKGPTLPDRILGLDMLVGIAIGFIAVVGIKTGYALYIDVAIALGLVGFLATVAFARFVLSRGKTEDDILAEARLAASEARREVRAAAKAVAKANDGTARNPEQGER
ncbi:Multisubunit Na+/H+ antiporter, MnhF subunit [Hoeflea phototrophica DFL-43]|uniref:Multisubunit Na+/H+ antiporter, MnhF subunit n=1 Tax=Hoeflea phototrophica (strain DSM 17068 / NCIMB 14078 / DFL-43) TaxID=411684 RepID=A9D3S7_HOEPD|nr:cation:proton antiporter [Hoeflea phototrophica]EDQ33734.1 Multisubunit Na+/H+ antiporter, MnhF subunit [Hoeflea phototrophica DFL-43]